MSLCLKGALSFEEEDSSETAAMRLHPEVFETLTLKRHERLLYEFIEDASRDDLVTFAEIERMINRSRERASVRLDNFRQASTALVEKGGYFDLNIDKKSMYLVSILAFSAGFLMVFFPLLGLPVFLSGFVCLYMTIRTKSYSQKGVNHYALWSAFKRFLDDLTLMDEKTLPELAMWDEYLVYAVAFGIGKKVLKALPDIYPDFYESDFYRYSYIHVFYHHHRVNFSSMDHLTSMSSALATAAHYRANSSGSGGSFSSGGGGGYAGGGSSSGGGGGSFS